MAYVKSFLLEVIPTKMQRVSSTKLESSTHYTLIRTPVFPYPRRCGCETFTDVIDTHRRVPCKVISSSQFQNSYVGVGVWAATITCCSCQKDWSISAFNEFTLLEVLILVQRLEVRFALSVPFEWIKLCSVCKKVARNTPSFSV